MTLLAGYTVLDLTNERGELTSMMLGDLGADVIKVEPPGGSSSRQQPPFLDEGPVAERSLRYFAFNRNKRSAVLDIGGGDREAFLQLVRRADILIESAAPGEMDGLGVGFEALREAQPRIVYVSITPFGHDGPYSQFAASDLTIAAMGGPVSLQGTPDRPPIRLSVAQVWLHASAEAAVATLIAHARMRMTGEAQYVDVSAQAAMVFTMFDAPSAYGIQGYDFPRDGSNLQLVTVTLPLVYACADGYVVLIPNGAALVRMIPWFVAEGIVPPDWLEGDDWRTYDVRLLQRQPLGYPLVDVLDACARFVARHTKDELLRRGLAENITIAPVNTAADLTHFEHQRARGYWQQSTLPDGRKLETPGLFARLSETPMSVRLPPPRLGEHTQEIIASIEKSLVREGGTATAGRQPSRLPLEGLKVADFSWIGVGPITAKYLADHGATVVRVETQSPADRLRSSGPFKDAVPGPNRSQYFGEFNTSKLGLTLNLKEPAGQALARHLIAWSDVYLESFTPGTVDDLGIGYDVARSLNPSIIMASTCLMGQTGPAAKLAGYGFHAAALAGFYEVTGWPDLAPDSPWQAYTNTVAPRFLATAILAALDYRRRTGVGQHIDCSQLEAALHFLAPQILDFNGTGRLARRTGNRDAAMAPHGVYPCAGEDEWCAIAVETDEQWRALKRVLGSPVWADDPGLATLAGRLECEDEIDARLAEWTRRFPPAKLMQLLQEAGIPAGAVQRSRDLLGDPQLAHRGFYRFLDHAEVGSIPYAGHQFRIRGYDNGPRFAAPAFGQHNELVLREILGLDEDELADALASGAIS